MKWIIPLILLSSCVALIAEEKPVGNTGYRIVHPDGTVEFTDDASRGGQEIKLRDVQTIDVKDDGSRQPSKPIDDSTGPPSRYRGLTITSPQQEQTLWFNGEDIFVSVAVIPRLRTGDMLVISLDGSVRARGKSTSLSIGQVDRGSHTLKAEIVDEDGSAFISADPVTFFVRHTSKTKPTKK